MSTNKSIFEHRRKESVQSGLSKVRRNREYLISQDVAKELNTYLDFTPFDLINDHFLRGPEDLALIDSSEDAQKDREKVNKKPLSSAQGVKSIFNKNAAVSLAKGTSATDLSEWRLSNNVPLLDSRDSREVMKVSSDCSVKNLVSASQKGLLGRETYDYSDFMYCKYLGKIPNNYMVTLRRFPFPVDDFISQIGTSEELLTDPDLANGNTASIGCLVTWMGTPGNDMNNILKYSVAMPFKEMTSGFQSAASIDAGADVNTGKVFNNIAAAMDPTYMRQATAGMAPLPFNRYISKVVGGGIENRYNVETFSNFVDANKTYGPVDAIKKVYMRDDGPGLSFEQNISLTFDYELRAYNGINTRQAMLDLIANILSVTYITGNWWKGAYRGGGAHQSNIFSNLKIFKTQGGFNDFVDAFAEDYTTITQHSRDTLKAMGGGGENWFQQALNIMKSALNTLGGMLLGGMLNKLGRPMKGTANSLLAGASVGFWHLTVGNPFHPIMSMGNMILKNTTIEHYGPLGLDDFPTGLRITCELTRGRSRDLRQVESLYMHGNDRIYSPMTGKVFDMYKHAKEYRAKAGDHLTEIQIEQAKLLQNLGAQAQEIENIKHIQGKLDDEISQREATEFNEFVNILHDMGFKTTDEDKLVALKGMLKKYYGTADHFSIFQASLEQEFGAQKKKEAAAGDNKQDRTSK